MSSSKTKKPKANTADIDEKTLAVFTRKGYQVLTILGAGSFGEVYKAARINFNDLSAVKVINLQKMSQKYKKKFLPRELAALMEIRHENIIRVFDIFRSNKKIYIFMEYAEFGDIAGYLKQNGALSESKARGWFNQTSYALCYLHEEMFTAHRDMKIDNILLTRNYIAKLTDFGFATEAVDADGTTILSQTYCGTMPYYCPQILLKQSYDPFKADVWAQGVVLYAMTHNKFPFHFKDPKLMVKEFRSAEFLPSRLRKDYSSELHDLITRLLEPNENYRPLIRDALKHPWAGVKASANEEQQQPKDTLMITYQ